MNPNMRLYLEDKVLERHISDYQMLIIQQDRIAHGKTDTMVFEILYMENIWSIKGNSLKDYLLLKKVAIKYQGEYSMFPQVLCEGK